MEVHHHPQIEKKNFKEYFFEFLMIFLAVTMGFFAEQIRENYVEHNHAKEYVRSFYEDLKTDTSKIAINIAYDQTKMDAFSNIAACYDSVSKNLTATSCMLDLIKNMVANKPFQLTDRTLKQLNNAGGYRLLKKQDADSITKYESDFNMFQDYQSTIYQEAQNNVRNTYNLLINFKANVLMKLTKPGNSLEFSGKDITEPLLFSGDKALLNKYFNELLLYYRITIGHQRQLYHFKKEESALINYFKNKYHFE
jgi:hypothetical protein